MGEYLGGRVITKSEREEIQKRNLARQTTYLRIHAGSGEWVIWPDNPGLNRENIKEYLSGVKVFQPHEVRSKPGKMLLVFNFDTGVGIEVTFQK